MGNGGTGPLHKLACSKKLPLCKVSLQAAPCISRITTDGNTNAGVAAAAASLATGKMMYTNRLLLPLSSIFELVGLQTDFELPSSNLHFLLRVAL